MNTKQLKSVLCIALGFMLTMNIAIAQTAKTSTVSPAKTSTAGAEKKATPAKPASPAKPVPPNSASTANDISGYWLTAQKGSIIQFSKTGNTFSGKMAWNRNPYDKSGKPLKDVNNPDKSKRNNPLIGTEMVTGLTYNPKTDTYENGKIYQPNTGKSFNCTVKLTDKNTVMHLTGGVGFITKTLVWTRTSGIPGK